jgi:hypothetical protein
VPNRFELNYFQPIYLHGRPILYRGKRGKPEPYLARSFMTIDKLYASVTEYDDMFKEVAEDIIFQMITICDKTLRDELYEGYEGLETSK